MKRFVNQRLYSTIKVDNGLKNVTVIGAGLMGSGIAQVVAQSGLNASLTDVSQEALKKSEKNILSSLQRVAKKRFPNDESESKRFVEESFNRIEMSTDFERSVRTADIVIESVVEKLELKNEIFRRIDKLAPQRTIFTSNTSSFLISEIAEGVGRLDRFGGTHFFNPVPVMKLLEIIKLPQTSEDTYEKLMKFGEVLGKTTITCKDTPGFVVNRLLVPAKAEAIRMLERGDATARDIDTAMKLGAGYPMGPFELSDYTGVDTFKFILDGWHKKYPDNPLFKPTKLADKMVAEGKIGRKTGEGFYKYN